MEFVGGFGFDNDSLVYQHVEALKPNNLAPVFDRNAYFTRHTMSSRNQLLFERGYVKILEKAESEIVVNFEESTDDGMSYVFLDQVGRHASHYRVQRNASHQTIPGQIIPAVFA